MTCGFLIQLVFCKKTNCVVYWCWSRARDDCTPPNKNPWSAPKRGLRVRQGINHRKLLWQIFWPVRNCVLKYKFAIFHILSLEKTNNLHRLSWLLKGHRKELRGIKILKFGSNFYLIVKRGGGSSFTQASQEKTHKEHKKKWTKRIKLQIFDDSIVSRFPEKATSSLLFCFEKAICKQSLYTSFLVWS